jgi:hypothetical protein
VSWECRLRSPGPRFRAAKVGAVGVGGSLRSAKRWLWRPPAQLIPTDRDPGAREAGVIHYIDIQLAKRLRKHQAAYRKGIAALDAGSRSKFGKGVRRTDSGSAGGGAKHSGGGQRSGRRSAFRSRTSSREYGAHCHGDRRLSAESKRMIQGTRAVAEAGLPPKMMKKRGCARSPDRAQAPAMDHTFTLTSWA